MEIRQVFGCDGFASRPAGPGEQGANRSKFESGLIAEFFDIDAKA